VQVVEVEQVLLVLMLLIATMVELVV